MRGIILVLLLAPAAQALTLSQLRTNTRVLVQDATSSRQRFSDSQINTLLNEAQQDAIEQTRCLRQSYSFQLVTGTTYYSLPTNFLTTQRLTIGAKYLQEMSPAGIDGRSRSWETSTGYPTYYFINFATRGAVGFAPFPGTSADTDTIKVEYDVYPNLMSADSDVPWNSVGELADYHNALPYFAATILSAIDNQLARAQLYLPLYTNIITQMGKRCQSRPNYLPSASGTP